MSVKSKSCCLKATFVVKEEQDQALNFRGNEQFFFVSGAWPYDHAVLMSIQLQQQRELALQRL